MRNRLALLCLIAATLFLGACSSKKAVVVKNHRVVPVGVIPSTDKQLKKLMSEARSWIGTPYVYGGSTKRKGTDCSGMVMQLFNDVYGLKLPRSSAMQREAIRSVKFDKMRPGDIVFFTTGKSSSRINHVGIYIGDNQMIHASTSRGVMASALTEPYWRKTYHSSGRVLEIDNKKASGKSLKVTEKQPKVPEKSPALPDTTTISIPLNKLQNLYNELDNKIDTVYVSNPEIFD